MCLSPIIGGDRRFFYEMKSAVRAAEKGNKSIRFLNFHFAALRYIILTYNNVLSAESERKENFCNVKTQESFDHHLCAGNCGSG